MCYNNRGITYFAQGEYDRAIADLDKAIQLEADFAKAYYNRGLVYRATGNPDAAIADFDQAIQFTSAFGLLSSHNLTPGPAKDRLGVLDAYRLQQADADLPSVYFYRGLAYSGKGDSIRAIADLQKALELGLETELAEQANALLAALPFTTAAASAPKPGHWEGVS